MGSWGILCFHICPYFQCTTAHQPQSQCKLSNSTETSSAAWTVIYISGGLCSNFRETAAVPGLNKPVSYASYQKPVTPEQAHVMGFLYSAASWSSALLNWALSSFLPLKERREFNGCFTLCWLASEPCQLCRLCLLVLSRWFHGPCWEKKHRIFKPPEVHLQSSILGQVWAQGECTGNIINIFLGTYKV